MARTEGKAAGRGGAAMEEELLGRRMALFLAQPPLQVVSNLGWITMAGEEFTVTTGKGYEPPTSWGGEECCQARELALFWVCL